MDRMVAAAEKVRQRLSRTTAILNAAAIPHVVTGDNAVGYWVSRVDHSAVRTAQDVDLLIRRTDFDRAKLALEADGFVYRHVAGIDAFLDSGDSKPRDAVHIVFAGEKVRPHESQFNPDVTDSEDTGAYRVLALEALVRIKLTAFRDKDRTHIRDLIGVGLIDASWLERLPAELAERLRQILDTPEG